MATNDIEVTIQSTLPSDEPQGQYRLRVSPEATVEHLLKQLCNEANTVLKAHYCLRNKDKNVLKLTDTLAQAEVQDGAILHWIGETVATKSTPYRCNTFWILALGSFIIGVVGIVVICIFRFRHVDQVYDFAIVFDAGSSHTSMFVYKWQGSKLNGTAVASQFGNECQAPGHGISDFANNPSAAGGSLESCIDVAKDIIPTSEYSNTPIYLGATAGMRLLRESNETASEAIFTSVRETFLKTPFKIINQTRSARIISGSEEGACSWITSNYLTSVFKVDPPGVVPKPSDVIVDSIGALDLGGASTQITFIPRNETQIPPEFKFVAPLFGRNYSLYTHSFLCYGAKEMAGQISAALVTEQSNKTEIEHPCLPRDYNTTVSSDEIFASPCVKKYLPKSEAGDYAATVNYTFVGRSNMTECINLLNRTLFNRTVCNYESCSFNNVYQPEVFGLFYAFSSFFYSMDFLNMTSANTSSFKHENFRKAADKICNSSWTELQQYATTKQEKANLMNYCMQSNYIDLLLIGGYGFNDTLWENVNFVQTISSTDVGWTLGFVLKESVVYPEDYPEVPLYTWTFAFLMVLFCLFLIVSLGLFIHGFRFRRSVDLNNERMSHYGAI